MLENTQESGPLELIPKKSLLAMKKWENHCLLLQREHGLYINLTVGEGVPHSILSCCKLKTKRSSLITIDMYMYFHQIIGAVYGTYRFYTPMH